VRPVRIASSDVVYRGPTDEIGDLWCRRLVPGTIESVWEPDEGERQILAAGGRVLLVLHSEPIPPVSMMVLDDEACRPVGEHPFKVESEPLEDGVG
jgi:hypothetical protein